MSELKRNIPPLFSKVDLVLVGILAFLIILTIMDSKDPLELKFLKISVALVSFAAIKGLSVIFQVYYSYSTDNPSLLPSIILTLLLVLIVSVMSAIGTWDEGDDIKEHVYDSSVTAAVLFAALVITKILSKRFSTPNNRDENA